MENNTDNKDMNFEQAMGRLEQIVKLLEKGDAPLENALGLFEEGTALAKKCSDFLDNAEKKIVKLVKGGDGTPVETDFTAEE
jgi:exodeoxyribonuclease VII small subunit